MYKYIILTHVGDMYPRIFLNLSTKINKNKSERVTLVTTSLSKGLNDFLTVSTSGYAFEISF
ncbi:MAG: hypothetical protein U9O90_03600, partial [Euryarchaeota archaeon]|nr:hypothetical protein [Euryarchaeota archaeon]